MTASSPTAVRAFTGQAVASASVVTRRGDGAATQQGAAGQLGIRRAAPEVGHGQLVRHAPRLLGSRTLPFPGSLQRDIVHPRPAGTGTTTGASHRAGARAAAA